MDNEYVTAIFGLVGVMVGGALTLVHAEYKDRKSQSKDLGYLAIHVVRALEAYVDKAMSVFWDDGRPGEPERMDAPYPEFKPEEITGEWKSMPAELAYRIFNLQTKTAYAVREIKSALFEGMYDEHNDYYEHRQRKFGDLTEEAIAISDDLRTLAKLPAREPNPGWDPFKMFKQALADRRAQQAQRRAD